MPCPYLEGEILKRCAALKGAMVLSVGELDDYCTTEQGFLHCEFFKRVEPEDKEISKEDA
jgi:hypothetical protein